MLSVVRFIHEGEVVGRKKPVGAKQKCSRGVLVLPVISAEPLPGIPAAEVGLTGVVVYVGGE